jgi:large subunit ribosomal protein L3
MGARKHSQPRRGSLAYSPRGRAKSMEARIRAWPEINSEEPKILAHCGFKAGCVQIVSIDDRDKTPNAGKQLVSLGTVLVTPPVTILGIRGYSKDVDGAHAEFDVYAKDIPKNIAKEITLKSKEGAIDEAENTSRELKKFLQLLQYLHVPQD